MLRWRQSLITLTCPSKERGSMSLLETLLPLHEVVREVERHHLRDLELVALVEDAVHVNVDCVAVAGVVHDVLGVSVAQADDVADLNRMIKQIEIEM